MGALWFTAAMPEPLLLIAFKYCLVTAAGAFVTARVCELAHLIRTARPAPEDDSIASNARNVKQLPQPERFPRAA
jgi:hypothetical protein